MFNIFKRVSVKDKILTEIKGIIAKGIIIEDNCSSPHLPHIKFKDNKGNTLYISWFSGTGDVFEVEVNGAVVPDAYGTKILKMASQRVQVLREEYLKRIIAGMKG